MRRCGGVVVIAGPDGAGKTTLATSLVEHALTSPVLHLHHRPGVLPRRASSVGEVTEPHAHTAYPRWLSVIKVLYLWADYQVGWWVRLRPVLRAGGSVVMERGWQDLAVDPLRYRLSGVRGFAGVLSRLLPQPDLVVVLVADTPTLSARRAELAPEEITRQIGVWRRWAQGRRNAAVVDVTPPLPEILDTVWRALDRVTPAA